MEDVIVVYKTSTGFTQRYAEWIGEKLHCKALSLKEIKGKDLSNYKTIIYGGGLYAGQINGLKSIKNSILNTNDQKIIIFATGATPMESLKKEDIIHSNFPEKKDTIPFFYFQSGINYEKMKIGHKMMMSMFKAMLKSKKDKTPEEQGMFDSITKSQDYSKEEYITPLIESITSNK